MQMVSEMDEYSMIYDFGGFPKELYQVVYPAKGSKAVSHQVQERLNAAGIANRAERKRGMDHGSWTILKRMYPDADIPLITMSVNPNLTPAEQYVIGKALAPLREQDVLIIGSGVTVHNFDLFRATDKLAVKSLVVGFEKWLENHMKQWDLDSLFRYEELAPNGKIAVPPQAREHFIPVFYAMGAAYQDEMTKTLSQDLVMDVIMNSVYQYGE